MVREGWDLEQRVDRRKKRNEKDWESLNQLQRGNGTVWLEVKGSQDQVRNDEDNGGSDDLIEGVLDKRLEPTPEDRSSTFRDTLNVSSTSARSMRARVVSTREKIRRSR